jgi:Fe-S-cluster-containing hydrogenase component 2
MILDRSFYNKISYLRTLWQGHQLKQLIGEKVFKSFKLHKTEWPNKLYFYSPRLKRIPRFSGNLELLSSWKESKLCETLCPTQAIKVTAKAFIIDDRGCIACGLCVELAPPGLLEMSSEPPNIGLDKD